MINTLRSKKVCSVAPIAGETKVSVRVCAPVCVYCFSQSLNMLVVDYESYPSLYICHIYYIIGKSQMV